jgi:hypothetical protein
LLQAAPALRGVAEIEGVRGAKRRRAMRKTLSFIETDDRY